MIFYPKVIFIGQKNILKFRRSKVKLQGNTGEKLATFKINEKNQTVIAVLDELAERVHQLVPNAGNQVSSLRAKSVCL